MSVIPFGMEAAFPKSEALPPLFDLKPEASQNWKFS